ncbi:MAG TPA: type II secretion system protein GspN [Candidatus Binatia bacterium]|jgi:type II secretion system protein N
MRFLLFVIAFAIGVLLMAPLDRWLLPLLRTPLAAGGVDLRVDTLRFALPFGVKATGVGLEMDLGSLDLDWLYFGITRSFEAEGCGGHIGGSVDGSSIAVNVSGVDLSRCLHIGKLEVQSTVDGSVEVEGFDPLRPLLGATTGAKIDLTSGAGVFRGTLVHAAADGSDLPLGEWEFSDLVLRASFSKGALTVQEGHAKASGVQWELLGANLQHPDAKGGLRVDLRARAVEDNPRSRAMISMMPRSRADADGWHNYRVVGTLSQPRVIGLE